MEELRKIDSWIDSHIFILVEIQDYYNDYMKMPYSEVHNLLATYKLDEKQGSVEKDYFKEVALLIVVTRKIATMIVQGPYPEGMDIEHVKEQFNGIFHAIDDITQKLLEQKSVSQKWAN